ncbi:MAG: sugar phosphate nucleotidyltransferase [archaeon]
MKERVTLTLESDVLNKVDRMVDGKKIKNRSHAVELLVVKGLGRHVPHRAVILAGGKGTRLRPITYEIPKALIPVHGKTLTEHLFDLLRRHGVTEIMMAVGHMASKIKDHFGDGKPYGISLTYVEEKEPMGTAGPLRMAKEFLKEPFIASNGDELKDIDIEQMYKLHREKGALCTIALTTVEDPSQYGVARLSGSKILEFVEKPKKEDAPSNLINSGFYIIEPEVVEIIPEGFSMLEQDVFPKLAQLGRLYGFPFSGQWFDTGNIQRYERAIKEWRDIT